MTNEESRERLRKGFGKRLMTDEMYKEMQRQIESGERIIISNDDLSRKRHPYVSLKQSQDDLRQLLHR